MYIPFNDRKRAVHKKIYKIKIEPKEGWTQFAENIIYIPFYGVLTTINSGTTVKLFSFYYSIEGRLLKIDNIKFISQSTVFNRPQYIELYYEYLFDALIRQLNNCPAAPTSLTALFVSSTENMVVDQFINRKFAIRKRPISDNSTLYTGLLLNGDIQNGTREVKENKIILSFAV